MPIAATPALSMPAASLARGSLVSEPVIPAGNGSAGSGANGSACSFLVSAAFVASCEGEGDGDGVCASVLAAKHEHKIKEAINKRGAMSFTRFIDFPLRVFHPA